MWKLQANQNEQSMEGYRTKVKYNGTAVNPEVQGRYDIGKSGACKTWHVIPHNSTK